MTAPPRKTLEEYLALHYPFQVIAEPEGGYVIIFPDLPGCMTQVERLEEIPRAAEEIRTLWIETEYAAGAEIPPPSYTEDYSGRFNVRLPRSLHRTLAEVAARDGVSLNQYVLTVLARGDALVAVERRLAEIEARIAAIEQRLSYHLPMVSTTGERRPIARQVYTRPIAA